MRRWIANFQTREFRGRDIAQAQDVFWPIGAADVAIGPGGQKDAVPGDFQSRRRINRHAMFSIGQAVQINGWKRGIMRTGAIHP